jgi:hypothetical protein
MQFVDGNRMRNYGFHLFMYLFIWLLNAANANFLFPFFSNNLLNSF